MVVGISSSASVLAAHLANHKTGDPAVVSVAAQELLEPDQAFRFEARMTAPDTLGVTWRIAPDHYMYRQRFSVSAVEGGVALGDPVFPEGKIKQDEYFGQMEVYVSDVSFTVPVTLLSEGVSEFLVQAVGQGCNEAIGVCFPPINQNRPGAERAGYPGSAQEASVG